MVVRVVHALQAVPAVTRIVVCLEDPAILAGILPDDVQVVASRPKGQVPACWTVLHILAPRCW